MSENAEIKFEEGATMKEYIESQKEELILVDEKKAKLKAIKMTFGDGEMYESSKIMTSDYEPEEE